MNPPPVAERTSSTRGSTPVQTIIEPPMHMNHTTVTYILLSLQNSLVLRKVTCSESAVSLLTQSTTPTLVEKRTAKPAKSKKYSNQVPSCLERAWASVWRKVMLPAC